MRRVIAAGAVSEGGDTCSVCSPRRSLLASLPTQSVTCGLCGGLVSVAMRGALHCDSCGDPIVEAADGVKLCDGQIVHAVCRPARGVAGC
jgi:hypothetical protein